MEPEEDLTLYGRYVGTVQRAIDVSDDAVKLGNYVKVNRVLYDPDEGIAFEVQVVHAPQAAIEHMQKVSPREAVELTMNHFGQRVETLAGKSRHSLKLAALERLKQEVLQCVAAGEARVRASGSPLGALHDAVWTKFFKEIVTATVAAQAENERLDLASGLKWSKISGGALPAGGNELTHAQLAKALQTKCDFSRAEWGDFNITALRVKHFIKAGVSYFEPADGEEEFSPCFSLRQMAHLVDDGKPVGYTAKEAKAAGFTLADIKAADYAKGIKEAGFSLLEAKEAGYFDIKLAGYSLVDAREAGYALRDIRVGGFVVADVKDLNQTLPKAKRISLADMKQAGYTAKQVKEAGFLAGDVASVWTQDDERQEEEAEAQAKRAAAKKSAAAKK